MKKALLLTLALIAVGCGPPSDGPYESYYDNGQLETKETYKDGELDGPYEMYYDNGQLWFKTTVKDGRKRCGEWFEVDRTVTYDPCPFDLEDAV